MSLQNTTMPVYAPPPARPFSGKAIAAFILSLLWLGGLGSVPGLFLSITAMRETRSGDRAGQGLAVAGLILSIFGLLAAVAFLVYVIALGNAAESQFAQVNQMAG